ncbi:MAG: hypothetical protein Ta2D_10230 [Rickettsiales bacterium]|nr:MAG: hypothetical protein Ta2D_10230 [Rickettsiales bacterium]
MEREVKKVNTIDSIKYNALKGNYIISSSFLNMSKQDRLKSIILQRQEKAQKQEQLNIYNAEQEQARAEVRAITNRIKAENNNNYYI